LKYAWIGDGNNMANSWIEAAGLLGLELALACPEGHDPNLSLIEQARALGATITLDRDPLKAASGASVVNTDVFASMGQEAEAQQRLATFAGFQVNEALLDVAASNAIVLHCLPAHRGEEISAEAIEGSRSRVWDQAEAR